MLSFGCNEKGDNKMKKIFGLLLAWRLCVGVTCTHIHDENCGYNPETKEGCVHEMESGITPYEMGPEWIG